MPDSLYPENPNRVVVNWDVAEELENQIDRPFLEGVLAETLAGRKPAGPFEISLTITTDEGIRHLNRRYRDIDSATDVLSFPMLDFEGPEQPKQLFPSPPGGPLALGDIVVSYPRAVEQAREYGHSLEREIAFLLVHAVMHLLGYDHEDTVDQQAMRHEEEVVLERLNLTR